MALVEQLFMLYGLGLLFGTQLGVYSSYSIDSTKGVHTCTHSPVTTQPITENYLVGKNVTPFSNSSVTCYVHTNNRTSGNQPITEKRLVGKRITLYSNSSVTFRYRLLIAGDINPNPGPQCDNDNDVANSNTSSVIPSSSTQKIPITYTREALLNLNGSHRLPVEVWQNVKHLKLNANHPTRRKKRRSRSNKTVSSLSSNASKPEVEDSDYHHDASNVSFSSVDANNSRPMLIDNNNIDNNDTDIYDCLRTKGFHCIHLNARSLTPKMSEVRLIASETRPSIFGISESWIDDSVTNCEIEISGYSVIRNDRNRHGGGVCIYVKSSLAFNPRPDLYEPNFEAVWAEILLPMSKPIIIGTCYRPQTHLESDFTIKLENVLSKLPNDSDVIVLGDINMCSIKADNQYKNYQNILNMSGFKQLIHTPTRVTDTSSSAIDHVMCNNMSKIQQYGVIPYGVSDHYIVYCTRGNIKTKYDSHKGIQIRSLKKYSKDYFVDELKNVNWSPVYRSHDVNGSWMHFRGLFTTVLDSVAPVKEVRIKNHSDPWMSTEILASIRERDSWLRKSRGGNHSSENYQMYRNLRNKVHNDIRNAKRHYMVGKIDDNKDNPKELWKHLKTLGYQSKSNASSNIVLDVDGEKCHDKKDVADHFNHFFTHVASDLVSQLPKQDNSSYDIDSPAFKKQYQNVVPDSFQLQEIDEEFVLNELHRLNINKSTGLDGIPGRFIKDAAEVIAGPITYIINSSLRSGVVPKDMKMAKVIPLHKKKSKLDAGNYRPVSILSAVSKILEKAVFLQLNNFLVENNLFYQFQSGFRGSYSTDTCLIHLQDHIRNQTAAGNYTGMILLDIQKAFDSVDHQILCNKLSAMGVQSIEWFHSYLSGRNQVVSINGVESDPLPITCGVPQGSILGPLLFLCYMNDMPNAIDCVLFQYADDSALIHSDKDPDKIGKILSSNLENGNKWLIENKLSLHMGKTELILFGSKQKLSKYSDFSIVCGGQTIKAKHSVVYLGLELNQYLDGEQIVLDIIGKVNSRLKFLYRQANFLNPGVKKTICSALVLCLFDYSISSWYGGISKYHARRLQCAQNKVIRFILGKDFRYHINHSDFKNLGILNINSRAEQLRLNHVFNIFNGTSPDYMRENFIRMNSVHSHNTRGSIFNFQVPRVKSHSAKSFYCNAIKFWNSLPENIKSIHLKYKFKKDAKSHILTKMDV